MKKLLVVTTYFHPQSGGVANHTYNLYRLLVRDYGYDVTVVASGIERNQYQEETIDGLKVYRLPYWFKISNTPINPLWYFSIRSIIKKLKPDLVCIHTPVPFMADIAALAAGGVPITLKYHHAGSMLKKKLPADILIKIYETFFFKYLVNKAQTVISASDYTRRSFLNQYTSSAITITPGVDLDRFEYHGIRTENKLLFVANLNKSERYKGLEYLLQALPRVCEKISGATLTVVGSGDDLGYYQKIVSDLDIIEKVDFRGRLAKGNLVNAYHESRIFVLPSLLESCPNVLLEAMAASLPVVGSNTTGIRDLIDDGVNGHLFPARDHEKLAEILINLFNHPDKADQMGERGYKMVKDQFSWSKIAAQTDAVIQQLTRL